MVILYSFVGVAQHGSDGTKLLPQPLLSYFQEGHVMSTQGQLHGAQDISAWKDIKKLHA